VCSLPRLANKGSLYGLLRAAYPLKELGFETFLTFCELCLYRILRTSENPLGKKFGEDPFRARENDPGSGPYGGCAGPARRCTVPSAA
jgi:hypothetical protein